MSQNEKIYIRNNSTQQWITNNKGEPIQFPSQRTAKRYGNKRCPSFIIVSYNIKTRKLVII